MVALGAMAISFFLVQMTKVFTLYVQNQHWSDIPLGIRIGAPVLIIGMIVAMGFIRYSSVLVSSSETIVVYKYMRHPILFCVLTIIPLAGVAAIVWKYYPTDSQLKQLRTYEQLKANCLELEQKIQTCKTKSAAR